MEADQRGWTKRLIGAKPFKLVAIALTNKLARIAFAILRDDACYGQAIVS